MVVRDRTLAKLKVGRQSVGGKAIDAFIKELLKPQKLTPKPQPPDVPTPGEQLPPVIQKEPRTWESRAQDFLAEVAGNG